MWLFSRKSSPVQSYYWRIMLAFKLWLAHPSIPTSGSLNFNAPAALLAAA
jgi:hypothetical protein